MNRIINVQGQTCANLKAELTARFAEISDHMLARDAFKGQDGNILAVELQLIGFF